MKINKPNRKQAIAGSIALAAVIALLGANSTALFSSTDDTATYAGIGKVVITSTEKVSVGDLMPKGSKGATLSFDNTTSSADVQMSISDVSTPSTKDLAGVDWSQFTVEIQDANGNVVYGPKPANAVTPGKINVVVKKGTVWTGKMVWSLKDVGNEFQGGAVHHAAVSFTGTQVVAP